MQSIETAPRDGSTILTECGFVRFLNQRQWGSPVADGKWAECDPYGNIYDCADNGPWLCEPKKWMPVPECLFE